MVEEVYFSEANSLSELFVIFFSKIVVIDRQELFQVAIHSFEVGMMLANLEGNIAAASTDVCEGIDGLPHIADALGQRVL
jgi:hypothetical protein